MRKDVIIAGAGIAGLSIALELRQRSAKVLVLERNQPGCEASTAAAGMLAATDPETPPALREFAVASARAYPDWITKLERISGIRPDFRRQGTIVLGEEMPPRNYRPLTKTELHELEPRLDARGHAAFFVAEDCVDPVPLMRALERAAGLAGVEMKNETAVERMRWTGAHVEVVTSAGTFAATAAINCMGAWSGAPVKPRKGQMMNIQPHHTELLQHVVRAPDLYIVPRSSGKILIGTTVEDVGFDKTVKPETIHAMHNSAARYIPELASQRITESWAGLRPGTPDDLPVIGPTTEKNVYLASGLFRNGILLAPAVAECAAALVLSERVPVDLSAFSPSRFTVAKVGS